MIDKKYLREIEFGLTAKINEFYFLKKNDRRCFEICGVDFEEFEFKTVEKMFQLAGAFEIDSKIILGELPPDFLNKLLESGLASLDQRDQEFLTDLFWAARNHWLDSYDTLLFKAGNTPAPKLQGKPPPKNLEKI